MADNLPITEEEWRKLLGIVGGMTPLDLQAKLAEKSIVQENEFNTLTNELFAESERGCVLVAAACLETALEKALRAQFHALSTITDKEIDDLLTRRPAPPLGSFASRSLAAYATGLIDRETKLALDAVRAMRNQAAHLSSQVKFDKYD